MGSSPTLRSKDSSIFSKEYHHTMKLHPSSRRTPSLSSLSSSSSSSSLGSSAALYDAYDYLPSPIPEIGFSRVPFSWEKLPGVPKKQVHNKKRESSVKNNNKLILPLPPTTTTQTSSKKLNFDDNGVKTKKNSSKQISFQRDDPFFAALVECSKDDDSQDQEVDTSFWHGAKVLRSLSDRFGFVNLYTSCKRTCGVSESIIYLPRSTRNSYDIINRST